MLQLILADVSTWDYWFDRGVMGVILLFIGGGIVRFSFWAKPHVENLIGAGIEMMVSLKQNDEKQTDILKCLKDSMKEHVTETGVHCKLSEEASLIAKEELETLKNQVGNHTKAATLLVENFREAFRTEFPEHYSRMEIDRRCNEMLFVLKSGSSN